MRVLLSLSLLFFSLYAQTYEEYLRSQEEAFSSFKEERDREFSEYLNQEWKAYKQSQGVKGYKENKPNSLPEIKKRVPKPPEKKIFVTLQPSVTKPAKSYTQLISPSSKKGLKTLYLQFFGVELSIHYDKVLTGSRQKSTSKETIADAWKKMAGSEYETTISELRTISQSLKLNDWAKYLLVMQVSQRIYADENEAKLFGWFLLLKLGYDARIAYQTHRIVLLLPVKGELYNTAYYDLSSKRYYAIDFYAKGRIGPVKSYESSYKGAQKAVDFEIKELPLFSQEKISKRLLFRINNKNQEVNLTYSKYLLHFFQSYPQVSYSNYFSSPESLFLQKSMREAFEPLLLGKSQSEALDIILNFVQHAFKYRVDREQFDKEKVMFPSETIFYPYSDCEDRAILFAYMVKNLLGMEVLGIKYPNHMATAVRIDERVEGEYVSYKNRAYIIADPTYINATVGLSMPRYKGVNSYEIISARGER